MMSKAVIVTQDRSLRKERIIFDGFSRENLNFIVRLDNRTRIEKEDADEISWAVDMYLNYAKQVPDLIVLSDYAGGALQDELLDVLSPVRSKLLVDTKRTDLSCFSGSLLAKLNADEYRRVLENDHSPERHFEYFIVTRGEMGARLMMHRSFNEQRREFPHNVSGSTCTMTDVPARDVKVADVCGCGDTFLAGLTAGLIRYGSPLEAISFANAAAATVVTQPRTAIADLQKTLRMIGREHEAR